MGKDRTKHSFLIHFNNKEIKKKRLEKNSNLYQKKIKKTKLLTN